MKWRCWQRGFLKLRRFPDQVEDAVHIAAAAVGRMDYLLTWNCKHIANAITMPKIFKVCNDSGYQCPIICTPEQLGKEENDE